jgi:hypothetical protein
LSHAQAAEKKPTPAMMTSQNSPWKKKKKKKKWHESKARQR